VRAVLVTGAGRNFCVGQDLAEHVDGLRADPTHAMDTVREHYYPIVSALAALVVPVVVGISGACVGAELGLAFAADLRIAGQSAQAEPESVRADWPLYEVFIRGTTA